ncbi:MAG: hypothetical protein ABI852_02475 [Gemmatimonadaceae bacterium]
MNDEREFDEAQLQLLRDKVKELPTEVAPASVSWTNIRDRIESSRVRTLPTLTGAAQDDATPSETVSNAVVESRIQWWRKPRTVTLIAASLFAVVTSAVIMRERDEQGVVTATAGDNGRVPEARVSESPVTVAEAQSGGTVSAPPQSARDTTVAVPPRRLTLPVAQIFAQYSAATLDLTRDLDARRSRLQPEALAVLDSCLHTIDQAIQESRAALTDAPDNATIIGLLQVTYKQKLDLLRRAADLPTVSLQD